MTIFSCEQQHTYLNEDAYLRLTSNLATVVAIGEDPLYSEGDIISSGGRGLHIE